MEKTGPARRPDVATRHVLATTTGTLYTAGGLAVFLGALDDPAGSLVLFAAAATALVTGAAVLRWGSLLPLSWVHALVAAGSLLVAVAVVAAPDPLTACVVAAVFTFVAVDVYYYFAGGPALAQLGLLLTAGATALIVRGVPLGTTAALLVVLVAIAVVVGDLADRASKASRDPLTGLLNRRGVDDALDAALTEAERTGTPLAVALVDVDRFKAVNDSQGHASGDALLRAIAQDLRRALPPTTVVGRPGGDEFVLLLPHLDDDVAAAAVRAAHARVRHPLSIGLVGHLGGESTGDVLHRADAALYEAKQGGRNRVVLGDAASQHLSRDLATALEAPAGSGLHVLLDPVVSVGDGSLVAVEAVVRWDHPSRGSIAPADLLAVAESTGLVAELGAFALRTACAEAAAVRQQQGDDLALVVGASGRELVTAGYADGVLAVLGEAGWSPHHAVVSVAEDVLEVGSGAAVAALHRLREAGVRVAVDGFGAVGSPVTRLDEVPADFLRMHPSLLATATTSARRRTLLQSLLAVCSSLGLVAVAQGVESAEQADLLTALGCPLAQGPFHGRPARAAELLASAQRADGSTGAPSPSESCSEASLSSSSSSSPSSESSTGLRYGSASPA
ncbi:bifunctional diguanylate cyclase/phosphodiesterase [Quadrisphaera setariae]|uniref:Bifunctional diguanylate cyclase/phosphodiesterase n=1 Tax=Quadrisphaera setariae TaxID=2593304 RepID=A0A5C8ZG68_9ACTN|nr:bifunctional diguanylate cyclase/phosphodiesterase [Quadrisphaera setariae]